MMSKKRVLRVSPQVFLKELYQDRMVTTDNIKDAKDINTFNWQTVFNVMSHLKEQGYKAEIVEVDK